MLENWARPYLAENDQKPRLFYAVFGEFELTETFHEIADSLADGLSLRLIEASYFRDGTLWAMAPESIQARASKTTQAVVIEGEVNDSDDLEYLRGVMDFLSYCCDEGGEVVYDPYMFGWFDREQWLAQSEARQILNPFDHVLVLVSDDWYHTRGLVKFGRPDLSIRGVTPDEAPSVKKIIDRFINFQALGGVIEEGREVKLEGLEHTYRPGPVTGDKDDPDFNNCHIELLKA